MEPATAKEYEL